MCMIYPLVPILRSKDTELMAHRDLTSDFLTRRTRLREQNVRFKLQHLSKNASIQPVYSLYRNKKLRAMGKALLQKARVSTRRVGSTNCDEVDVLPLWVKSTEDANEAIRLLNLKLEYLQLLHTRRLMIRFDESEKGHEVEVEDVTNEIVNLFHRANHSLQKMRSMRKGPQVDRIVQCNVQQAIAFRIQNVSAAFRKCQREYLERLQLQRSNCQVFSVLESFTDASDHVIDWSQRCALRCLQVVSRDREIQRIFQSVTALTHLFREVATIVIEQGSMVDRIDFNMTQVRILIP
uniref:Syntaxinlike protein putative n=1 Tax=Albugo laibachii Nc14 TaxID=890382 RepID=F0W5J7_9STRA|nr:syntaxinlike protein putative [Albugo laibachii Nc14]|eukprot:CCA16388.1 syntaxinlike protein putative [Albugo laibachii Nc14]